MCIYFLYYDSTDILNAIFHKYKIESIIDVGANEGQFGLFLREIGFKGKIISFEPVKQAFEKLNIQSSKDENWDVFNFALGSKISNNKINVAKSSIFSSFLKLNNFGLANWNNAKTISENNSGFESVTQWKITIQTEIIWYDLVNNKDIINKIYVY